MTNTTSITLPLVGAYSEDVSYEVTWQAYDIGGCSVVSHANKTTITDGSTTYNITRLEEDSCYSITVKTLTLSNNTKVSMAVVTSEAGERVFIYGLEAVAMSSLVVIIPAPSAPPSSVSLSEVTSSNITVQWRPVDCIHRNGAITGYSVQYGSDNVSVSGDSSGGMYVISGLMPSTAYSIQVAAETSVGTGPYSTAIYELTAGMILMLFYLFAEWIR